jgi:arginyl-tRNA synthetase
VTPAQLSRSVLYAVRRAAESGQFGEAHKGLELPGRVVVESPPRRGAGDYAVSVAFRIAKAVGMSPYEVACVLRDGLTQLDGVRSVEISGGGFLNVTLDDLARSALVEELSSSGYDHEPSAQDRSAADTTRWRAVTGDDPALLTVRTTASSPLFHVQYAYARTRALSHNAHDLGFRSDSYAHTAAYGTSARALLALLADHQRISEQADPAQQARHLVAVGDAFFDFQEHCPPLPSGDEKPGAAHRARLALVEATGAVLAGGLSQLGVTAPAHL